MEQWSNITLQHQSTTTVVQYRDSSTISLHATELKSTHQVASVKCCDILPCHGLSLHLKKKKKKQELTFVKLDLRHLHVCTISVELTFISLRGDKAKVEVQRNEAKSSGEVLHFVLVRLLYKNEIYKVNRSTMEELRFCSVPCLEPMRKLGKREFVAMICVDILEAYLNVSPLTIYT